MKRIPSGWMVLVLLVSPFSNADFTCPPFQNRSRCEESAWQTFVACKDEMGELLRDPDALTVRYHAYYMLNVGCGISNQVNERSCASTCQYEDARR